MKKLLRLLAKLLIPYLSPEIIKECYKKVAADDNLVIKVRKIKKGRLKYRLLTVIYKIGNKNVWLRQYKIDRHNQIYSMNTHKQVYL